MMRNSAGIMMKLARSIPFSTPPMTMAIVTAMKKRWKPMAGVPLEIWSKYAPVSAGNPVKMPASA